MKRLLMVLSWAAIMAAVMLASAMPAFADKGGVKGHQTTDLSGDCVTFKTSCTIDRTSSGKEGNLEGGPGHATDQSFINPGALGTSDTLLSEETTSSGHTADGGGRRTFEFNGPGDFLTNPDSPMTSEETCVGSGAPGC